MESVSRTIRNRMEHPFYQYPNRIYVFGKTFEQIDVIPLSCDHHRLQSFDFRLFFVVVEEKVHNIDVTFPGRLNRYVHPITFVSGENIFWLFFSPNVSFSSILAPFSKSLLASSISPLEIAEIRGVEVLKINIKRTYASILHAKANNFDLCQNHHAFRYMGQRRTVDQQWSSRPRNELR